MATGDDKGQELARVLDFADRAAIEARTTLSLGLEAVAGRHRRCDQPAAQLIAGCLNRFGHDLWSRYKGAQAIDRGQVGLPTVAADRLDDTRRAYTAACQRAARLVNPDTQPPGPFEVAA